MIHAHVAVARNIKNAVEQIFKKFLEGDDWVLADYKTEVLNMIDTIKEMGASL